MNKFEDWLGKRSIAQLNKWWTVKLLIVRPVWYEHIQRLEDSGELSLKWPLSRLSSYIPLHCSAILRRSLTNVMSYKRQICKNHYIYASIFAITSLLVYSQVINRGHSRKLVGNGCSFD